MPMRFQNKEQPHALSHEGFRAINEFAEAEHTAATMAVLKHQGRYQTTERSHQFQKISYPGEEETVIAVTNIEKIDALFYEERTQHHCGRKITAKCSKVLSGVHEEAQGQSVLRKEIRCQK